MICCIPGQFQYLDNYSFVSGAAEISRLYGTRAGATPAFVKAAGADRGLVSRSIIITTLAASET